MTTLTYDDGTSLTVPAVAHKDAIATLHARTPPAIVVCHVTTGSIRLDDPDAMKFPVWDASPPNRPTPPAAGSVIGWSVTDADPNERFLDIHSAKHAVVAPLIGKRIELAKTIGCDAIAAMRHDLLAYQATPEHGFADLLPSDYQGWSTELAGRAHALELSIGLRSSAAQGIDGTAQKFDWLMMDPCAEGNFCDQAQPYLNAQKAVIHHQ